MINVLLVDDHAVVRTGYRRLLETQPHIRILAEAATAEEGRRLYFEQHPDVVVMDISMPGIGGIEGIRRILSRDATARILICSIHDNSLLADRALQSGALGYVTKASDPEVLVKAVETVGRGKVFLGPDIAQALALKHIEKESSPLAVLSPREFEIFRLVADGRSGNIIADRLCLSTKTVSNYLSQIKKKLDVSSTAELVHLAMRHGLLSDFDEGGAVD
jgi:two-component system invasion response regulator UvrY